MGHKASRVNEFRLQLENGEMGQFSLLSRGRSSYTDAFFNVRGTWHFSQHGAPLWIAVRFSVLWPDDPSMHYARGTPFNHLGHTTQLLCGQSTLTNGQGSEHFLVAFYDKLSATAGLFFSLTPGTRTGLFNIEE